MRIAHAPSWDIYHHQGTAFHREFGISFPASSDLPVPLSPLSRREPECQSWILNLRTGKLSPRCSTTRARLLRLAPLIQQDIYRPLLTSIGLVHAIYFMTDVAQFTKYQRTFYTNTTLVTGHKWGSHRPQPRSFWIFARASRTQVIAIDLVRSPISIRCENNDPSSSSSEISIGSI